MNKKKGGEFGEKKKPPGHHLKKYRNFRLNSISKKNKNENKN